MSLLVLSADIVLVEFEGVSIHTLSPFTKSQSLNALLELAIEPYCVHPVSCPFLP